MTPSWRTGREAADPPRTPVLFVNPRSGGGAAARARVAERAREQGIEVVELGGDQELRGLVDQAVAGGADALGMAGGDGSLAVVAAAASAHELPFICVPAGTRNHFARDLGLDPGDPAGALSAFGDGVEGRIDLGGGERRALPELGLPGRIRRGRPAIRVPRCEGSHAARDRSRGSRSERSGARAEPGGRSRRPARPSRDRARVQQSLRAGATAGPWRPPEARRRTSRNHRHRRAAPARASAGAGVERALPRGRCAVGRARRPRRRGGRARPAASVLDPAARASGQGAATR